MSASGEGSGATGINGNQSDNSAGGAGAVYVFIRSAGAWAQQAYVKASNTEAADQFGHALALSADGSTLAVGAELEDSSAVGVNGNETNNAALNSGAVYVFTRTAGVWSQQAYVKASNTASSDYFGWSVALGGNGVTLAVGAHLKTSASGAVVVFTRSGDVWTQQAVLTASNNQSGDQFGYAVALSADGATLAVTAIGEDSNATGIHGNQSDNSASNSGAAYVFTRDNGVWTQQAYLKPSNTEALDLFGWSVALSADGGTLAVGSPAEASNATGVNGNPVDNSILAAGAAYVYARDAGAWSQQAYVKPSNTNSLWRFGWSAALSADGAVLALAGVTESSGATGVNGNQSDISANFAGAVYLY